MVMARLGKSVEWGKMRVEFGVHVHQSVGGVQVEVETEANDGGVEGLSEIEVFEKRGCSEEGREQVAIGGDAERAQEVEGGEGVAEEAVRGVAFDDANPSQGVRRCFGGLHDLGVELFHVARGNHRVGVPEEASHHILAGTH